MKPIFFKNPLVGLETCRAVLGKSADACLGLVESGRLQWAFNLAAPGTGRALWRVLSLSLADIAAGTSTAPTNIEGAIKYVLPGSAPEIRASALARAWSVSGTHLSNLIECDCLQVSRSGRLAKESPLIERSSAVRFMEERQA